MSNMEVSKYTAYFSPQAHEAAPSNKAFPRTLSNWMQEAARQHADILGLGVETLLSQKKTWLLTRQRLEINRYPSYGEKVKVITWPKGFSGLFANRDFLLEDSKGNIIARGTTSWVILDLKILRPIPIDLPPSFSAFSDEHSLKDAPEKLLALGENAHFLGSFPVLYSHLDVNQHVNNSQYVNYALDALSASDNLEGEVQSWTANFLFECTLGDTLRVFCDQAKKPSLIEVRNTVAAVFRIQLQWFN